MIIKHIFQNSRTNYTFLEFQEFSWTKVFSRTFQGLCEFCHSVQRGRGGGGSGKTLPIETSLFGKFITMWVW